MIRFSSMLLLIAFAAFGIAACGGDARYDPTSLPPHSRWVFEGWSCAPEPTMIKKRLSPAQYCEGKPAEYLYLKISARASAKAIRTGNEGIKQNSCRAAALHRIRGNGMMEILIHTLQPLTAPYHNPALRGALEKLFKTKGPQGIYDCCALDQDTGRCVGIRKRANWTECTCVAYRRIPGGRKALQAAVPRE